MIREACGIAGAYSFDNRDVSTPLFYLLYSLQHRGQESAGITTSYENSFITEKGMGLVYDVFDLNKIKKLKGSLGIGHVRYSTFGESKIENAQPFVVTHSKGSLAIAHNGNIANGKELKSALERQGEAFSSTTDSEVIAKLIVRELVKKGDIAEAIAETMKKLQGSYSLTILTNDEVIAVRDPLGIKPLYLGKVGETYLIASESVALDPIGAEHIRDIMPGEILAISSSGKMKSHRPFKMSRKAHCMFEYVYFSRTDSVVDGVLVYAVREKIGEIMAEDDNVEADAVMPVPDSAIPFALGYSRKKGIPYIEGLIKNRYVGRTFILPQQSSRELAVKMKLNPIKENIRDKRIVVFDDSVVRGTTSKKIVMLLKNAGAKEVHFRVGCPPIISPCFLGIDMPTKEELIASSISSPDENSDKALNKIRKELGADSLKYLSLEGLLRAIGKTENELCLGCLTGKYPVGMPIYEQMKIVEYI